MKRFLCLVITLIFFGGGLSIAEPSPDTEEVDEMSTTYTMVSEDNFNDFTKNFYGENATTNYWYNEEVDRTYNGITFHRISDYQMRIYGTSTAATFYNMTLSTALTGTYTLAYTTNKSVDSGAVYIYLRSSSDAVQVSLPVEGTYGYAVGANKSISKLCYVIMNGKTVDFTINMFLTEGEVPNYHAGQDYDYTDSVNHVFHVEKGTTGDFSSLKDAIEFAENYMDSVVYVGAGTWDLLEELGSDYVSTVSVKQRGIYLKNRIHLIFASDSLVTLNYDGSRVETTTWLSAFNAGQYGFTLENLNIEVTNIRYVVHDERDTDSDFYVNKYINCRMKIDNSGASSRPAPPCIGGGMGLNGYVVIDGCVLETVYYSSCPTITWHNTVGSGKSHLIIKNCYFPNYNRIRINYYGASTEVSQAEVSNCSMYLKIEHGAESSDYTFDNFQVTEWGNTFRTT